MDLKHQHAGLAQGLQPHRTFEAVVLDEALPQAPMGIAQDRRRPEGLARAQTGHLQQGFPGIGCRIPLEANLSDQGWRTEPQRQAKDPTLPFQDRPNLDVRVAILAQPPFRGIREGSAPLGPDPLALSEFRQQGLSEGLGDCVAFPAPGDKRLQRL